MFTGRTTALLTASGCSQTSDDTDSPDSLRAQLAEQRARETQILTAYKQLREELRKMQATAYGARKAPLSSRPGSGTTPVGDVFSSGAAGVVAAGGTAPPPSSSNSNSATRALKRLSLPLHDLNGFPRALQDIGIGPGSAASGGGGGSPLANRRDSQTLFPSPGFTDRSAPSSATSVTQKRQSLLPISPADGPEDLRHRLAGFRRVSNGGESEPSDYGADSPAATPQRHNVPLPEDGSKEPPITA